MLCPACQAINADDVDECFTCGKALHALTCGSILNGRYEVRRLLGRGGMGRVYEALDRVLEEPVAIKVLLAELIREPGMSSRLRSEIKLARKVSHRNVCRIHEYGEHLGAPYISMELIEGRNLTELLRERPRTVAEVFELVYQIAAGLGAIHEHGIVHRDFKTANIMVNARGVAKIMDFGIAKQLGEGGTQTLSGLVLGTPDYMSPEQIQGERLDCRSDIYSLGCVVFEIFTGTTPFRAGTPYATLLKQLNEPPLAQAAARRLSPAMQRVIAAALAKDRHHRLPTVGAFVDALREAQASLRPETPAAMAPALQTAPTAKVLRGGVAGPTAPPVLSPPPRRARNSQTVTLSGSVRPRGFAGGSPSLRRALPLLAALVVGVVVASLRSREPADFPSPAPPRQTLTSAPVEAPIPSSPSSSPPSPSSVPDPASSPPLAVAATPVAGLPATSFGASTRTRSPEGTDREGRPAPAVPIRRPSPEPFPATVSGASTPSAPRPSSPGPAAATPAATGTLALTVVPPAQVVLDDTSLGTLTRRDITLGVGTHTLRVLHPDYEPLPRRFRIRPRETLTLLLDLQEKGIPKRPR